VSTLAAPQELVLFLHLPKTGGTTLYKYFYSLYPLEPHGQEGGYLSGCVYHYPGGFDKNDTAGLPDLERIVRYPQVRIVLGHFSYGVHALQDGPAGYVTILREPVERAVSLASHYLHWSQGSESLTTRQIEDFLMETRRAEFDNDQTRRIAGAEPPIGECTPELLATAKAHLDDFPVVGLTERFDETIVLLGRSLNWTLGDVYYPARLVNPERPPSSMLSGEVLAAIRERERYDVELYEHASRLFEERLGRVESLEDGLAALADNREAYIREYGGPY
jgi:hypothetical protein